MFRIHPPQQCSAIEPSTCECVQNGFLRILTACLSAVRRWDSLEPGFEVWTGAFIPIIEVGSVMNPDRFKDLGLTSTPGSNGELKNMLLFFFLFL